MCLTKHTFKHDTPIQSVCCDVLMCNVSGEVRQPHTRADTHQDGETRRSSRVEGEEGGGGAVPLEIKTQRNELWVVCVSLRPSGADIQHLLCGISFVLIQASQSSVPVSGPGSLPGHTVSRSYLPSAAGQAAYYQAETCGGLAVCQPLTRISNHHHFQGESPAEEVSKSHEYVDICCI